MMTSEQEHILSQNTDYNCRQIHVNFFTVWKRPGMWHYRYPPICLFSGKTQEQISDMTMEQRYTLVLPFCLKVLDFYLYPERRLRILKWLDELDDGYYFFDPLADNIYFTLEEKAVVFKMLFF